MGRDPLIVFCSFYFSVRSLRPSKGLKVFIISCCVPKGVNLRNSYSPPRRRTCDTKWPNIYVTRIDSRKHQVMSRGACCVCVCVSVCVCACVCECVVAFPSHKACSTSLSSGNQVDSLPLVAHSVFSESHTGKDGICQRRMYNYV